MNRRALPLLVIAQFAIILGLAWKIHDLKEDTAPPAPQEAAGRSGKTNAVRPGSAGAASFSARNSDSPDAEPLDPQQAAAMLAQNRKSEKNLNLRADRAAAILRRLCKSGYAKEAWELIEPEYGLERSRALEAYFRSAELSSAEVTTRMAELDAGDRGAALRGYLGQYPARELAMLDLSPFSFSEGLEQAALADTLNKLLSGSGEHGIQDPAAARLLLTKAAEWAAANKLRMGDFGKLMEADKSQDSFAHWTLTTTLPEGMRKADPPYDGVQARLIRGMSREDPERLMAMTMIAGAPEERFMHIAFGEWLDADTASAKNWHNSHQAGFTVEQQDRAAVAFLRFCVRYGEYEEGLEWYSKISGANWRSALAYEQRNAMNGIKKKAAAAGK